MFGKVTIRKAISQDMSAIQNLLNEVKLPSDDLPTDLSHFIIAEMQGNIVGVAGLTVIGDQALIRDVVVSKNYWHQQIGKKLFDSILYIASLANVHSVYLILLTGQKYFERQGFQRISIEEVPNVIQEIHLFQYLYEKRALIMKKSI